MWSIHSLHCEYIHDMRKKRNYSYNGVRMLSACPHRVPCPWPSARVVWGRKIASVGEFLICAVVKCHLSEAGHSPPGRRVRSSEPSLCVVRPVRVVVCGPPDGRAGGRASVVSRRVILLRCLRIRGPTGPANLCTRGRLPSNGGTCIRSQGDTAAGHVARTRYAQFIQVYMLLAASATTARRASSRSCARVAALAGTQLIYSEFIRETCTYFTMQTRQATYIHAYSYPGVHAPSHYTLTYI